MGAATWLCGHLERVQSVRTRWTDRLCRACPLRSRKVAVKCRRHNNVPPEQRDDVIWPACAYYTTDSVFNRELVKILSQPARDGPRLPAAGHHGQHNSRPERRHQDRHSLVTGTPYVVTMTYDKDVLDRAPSPSQIIFYHYHRTPPWSPTGHDPPAESCIEGADRKPDITHIIGLYCCCCSCCCCCNRRLLIVTRFRFWQTSPNKKKKKNTRDLPRSSWPARVAHAICTYNIMEFSDRHAISRYVV